VHFPEAEKVYTSLLVHLFYPLFNPGTSPNEDHAPLSKYHAPWNKYHAPWNKYHAPQKCAAYLQVASSAAVLPDAQRSPLLFHWVECEVEGYRVHNHPH